MSRLGGYGKTLYDRRAKSQNKSLSQGALGRQALPEFPSCFLDSPFKFPLCSESQDMTMYICICICVLLNTRFNGHMIGIQLNNTVFHIYK